MKTSAKVLGVLGVFILSHNVQAQFKTWPLINLFFKNQFDKQGYHHGRWRVKMDVPGTAGKQLAKGRYQHGHMIGTWKTYYPDKTLQQLEICTFEDGKNILETVRYHANGKVEAKGLAAIERLAEKSRYYRFGEWLYYQDNGAYTKTILYEIGWPIKTTFADGRTERSIAPKSKVYGSGEAPKFERKPGSVRMYSTKNGSTIKVKYHENGDSTVTITLPQ